MKILFVTIDNYPHRGGKSTHISSLLSGLNELEVECDVFSGNMISNVEFNVLKCLVYPIKFLSKKRYMYYRIVFQVILFKKELKKYIKNKKYDVISFQDAITCGTCGDMFDNSFLTMHTYFGIEYTLDNSGLSLEDTLYKKLLTMEENSLNYVKGIICVDDRIKMHVIETAKKYDVNLPISSIENFTNTDLFKPCDRLNNGKTIIGCVRRLVEKNGVIYAVQAMKYLKDTNCCLKIYGEGPCLDEINEYIMDNGLEGCVELCGGVDNDQMAEIYNTIDIVVVPSITVNGLQEATSISAIESMACGIPTIASDIGGLPLLIKDNKTGFLVKEKDPEAISEKIKILIEDKKIYSQIGKKAREYIVNNHSHLNAAREYLEKFEGK